MIKLHNVNKSFEKEKLFSDLNLSIENGSITAIMGVSGIGKTTLLRMIGGLDKDYTGTITGVSTNAVWSFQDERLLNWMNLYDNLSLVLKDKLPEKEVVIRINNILSLVYLTGNHDKFPSELSGGMQKRVSLARAFITDSDTIILDEPFTGLDSDMILKIASNLLTLAREKKLTVILVTHNSDVAELADRIITI